MRRILKVTLPALAVVAVVGFIATDKASAAHPAYGKGFGAWYTQTAYPFPTVVAPPLTAYGAHYATPGLSVGFNVGRGFVAPHPYHVHRGRHHICGPGCGHHVHHYRHHRRHCFPY